MIASFPASESYALPPQRLALPGGTVTYRCTGTGSPLLLIHGWGASSRYWLHTFNTLADTHTLYALDLPGFGDSPPSGTIASAERLAALVIEFADALGLHQFDLNGHSFGAGVAAYIAAHWPTRVKRLVLTCFAVPRNDLERYLFTNSHYQIELSALWWRPWLTMLQPWQSFWQPWVALRLGMPPFAQALAANFLYQVPSDHHLLQEGIMDLTRMDLRTAIESASSIGNPALINALAAISAPTLVVGGQQDQVLPPDGVRVVAETVKDSRLALIDKCGHVPMVEQPDLYHLLLREFLA